MTNMLDIQDGVLVHCKVNKPEVVVPAEVTKISQQAFRRCENLKKVTILGPAVIESEAFLGCKNLKEVFLADGVKSIGSECFAYCEQLEELFIPNSVEHIGSDIACMNEASHRQPSFLCERRGMGKDWSPNWNRIFHDYRFGDDRSHMFFHPTYYGMARDEEERKKVTRERVPVTDIPHGTGVKKTEREGPRPEPVRIPDIKLRLWLTVTKKAFVGEEEYALFDDEKEMMPRLLVNRNEPHAAEHELDKPWEIVITDETDNLAPELVIKACMAYGFPFDGETLTIAHDMPWRKNTYDELAISQLRRGETIIAEKEIANGNYLDLYNVRLFIQWPDEPVHYWTQEDALSEIQAHKPDFAALNDTENVIAVYLAHGNRCAEHYKGYQPSVFPEQFLADFAQDCDQWNDLGAIIVQPCELYKTYHDYSDDYKCAAGISDDDDTSWTETHTRSIEGRLNFEINNTINTMETATQTPDFKEYKAKFDLNGYMAALWQAADQNDRDSLLALLYLAAQTRVGVEALDRLDPLYDMEEPFAMTLFDSLHKQWKDLSEDDQNNDLLMGDIVKELYNKTEAEYIKEHPDYVPFRQLFGDADLTLQLAYKNRVGRQDFITPEITDYRKADDINGYFKALWQGVEAGDRESMHILLYLASQTSATEDALDILEKMQDVDYEYALLFMQDFRKQFDQMSDEDKNDHWKLGNVTKGVHCMVDLLYNKRHPEHRSAFKRFDPEMDIILRRAYCDGVGRQPVPDAPEQNIPINHCVPKETKDYWRGLYNRFDCSSNQESIYNDALEYAKQGDPYAMFIVGFLLKHGIRTKYSHPNVTILESDPERAFPWLKRAADADIIEACWETASVLFNRKDDPKAEEQAWQYIEKGAEQNNLNCLNNLFLRYEGKDDHKAFTYLERMAELGRTHEYKLKLANWYEQGRGCEKNEKKAFELVEYVYNHSSLSPYDSSYEDACEKLQYYLKNGIGCEKDADRSWKIHRDLQREEDDLYELLSK